MKRYKILPRLILFAISLVGCSEKAVKDDPGPAPDPEDVVLTLKTESGIPAVFSLSWNTGEKAAVWDGFALREFTAMRSGENIVFAGKAAKDSRYTVVYPYKSCVKVDGGSYQDPSFQIKIGDGGILSESSVRNEDFILIGTGGADAPIVMKHVYGLYSFRFHSAVVNGKTVNVLKPGTLDHVLLKSNGTALLSGNASLSLKNNVPAVSTAKGNGHDVVSFSFERNPQAGERYYIVSLPGSLGTGVDDVTIGFTRSSDSAVGRYSSSETAKRTLKSGEIVELGDMVPKWQAADDSAPDIKANPSGTFDYDLLEMTSHPRIIASDEDFRVLKEMIKSGDYPLLTLNHNAAITKANKYLSESIPTLSELDAMVNPTNGSYQNTFNEKFARPSLDHLMFCSYAYRTTGEKRYLTEAKKVIAARCRDQFWSKNPEGKTIAYISVADLTLGMAVAYDWLYYDLTESERAAIRKAVMTLPFSIGESKVSGYCLRDEVNNRGQVGNAGIMAAALAMFEKDKEFSKKWMEISISGIKGIVRGIYGKTGSTEEGYGYWEYGTSYQAWYNEMLSSIFGTDFGLSDNEGFQKTGDYNLYMADHLSPFSFSDGGWTSETCKVSPCWLALKFQKPEWMLMEAHMYGIGRKPDSRVQTLLPVSLSRYPRLDVNGLQKPSKDVWADSNDSGTPIVLAHTGWKYDETDQFLGLKGGYASVSHGHMDVGTVEYHAYGQRWSVDNGGGSYALYTNQGLTSTDQTTTAGYVKWLAMAYGSLGHSTISFANYDKSIGGINKTHNTDHIVASTSKATILETYDTPSEKGGKIDMSKTFKGQVQSITRKAVIKDGKYLLVEDCVKALDSSDALLIWRMITPPTVTVEISDASTLKLSQNGKTMYLHPTFNAEVKDLKMRNWGSFDDAHPGKTGEWGWTSADHKLTESINARVVGYTVTIPKGKEVTISTVLTNINPALSSQDGVTGENPDFGDGDKYDW